METKRGRRNLIILHFLRIFWGICARNIFLVIVLHTWFLWYFMTYNLECSLGNYYGTPKPPPVPLSPPTVRRSNSASDLPGMHPSSDGKRKRNRSNIDPPTSTSKEKSNKVYWQWIVNQKSSNTENHRVYWV